MMPARSAPKKALPPQRPARATSWSDGTLTLATLAALAVMVFAVYGRAIHSPFIFDDIPGILENPSILRLWPPFGDADTPGPLNPPRLGPTDRRPLPNLTFALNYRFGRLEPAGYHVVNLVVHVLVAAMLAALLRRTLRLPYFEGRWDSVAWPLSFAVALVWALHPLATDAVAYVIQRTELMVALFYVTTLWAALRYWTASSVQARRGWLVAATLACLAGMASKEIMIFAPLVVLLFEWTFLVRSAREMRRSWPLYAGLSLGWALLFLLTWSKTHGVTYDARHSVPLYVWWFTQAKVLFLYLKLAFWPWPLSIHYGTPFVRSFAAASPWLAAVAILVSATLFLLWRRRAVGFVIAATGLMLAPTSLVPILKVVAAERRMYLPLAGLVTLVIVGGYRWISDRWPRSSPRLSAVAVTIVVVVAGVVSAHRLAAYETAVGIWEDAVAHQPDDSMAHFNLGTVLVAEHRRQDAMTHFEQALRLDPEYTKADDNLGALLLDLGRPQDAIAYLERALRIDPDDATAHNNLGAVLTTLGRPEEAIGHLSRALVLESDQPKSRVHRNLGNALLDTGRTEEGIAHLERAVTLEPDDADAEYSLGIGLLNAGRSEEAIAHLEQARRLDPNDAEVYGNLGTALLRTGHAPEAVEQYLHALKLKPDYVEAHNNLATALLHVGRTEDAIAQYEAALRLKPDHATAHYNLGTALLETGRPAEAVAHFKEAARLSPNDPQVRLQGAIASARSNDPAEAWAMAADAIAVARAQGDMALAEQIAAWLEAYRAQPAN